MSLDNRERDGKKMNLKKLDWILNSGRFDADAVFHLFMALFRSKVSYAILLLSAWDTNTFEWYRRYHYQAFKKILGITDLVNSDRLLELCLGKDFESYIKQEQLNTIKRILNYAIMEKSQKRIKNVEEFCRQNKILLPTIGDGETHVIHKQLLPLK